MKPSDEEHPQPHVIIPDIISSDTRSLSSYQFSMTGVKSSQAIIRIFHRKFEKTAYQCVCSHYLREKRICP